MQYPNLSGLIQQQKWNEGQVKCHKDIKLLPACEMRHSHVQSTLLIINFILIAKRTE